jgi:BirA family transcriptional regulator, biotin operon repressor / biotin---[acetyl-CoA-carboxylase] ligase
VRVVTLDVPARWRLIEHHDEVGSTNEIVADRARLGEPDGLVVVADHQTRGRGRLDRTWEDAPGRSLLMSALVGGAFPRPTLVPLAVGVAVADALVELGAQPALKWPNDVLVAEGKCGGILVERVDELVVIGIGMNVDWRGVDRRDAAWISLAEVLDRDVDRWDLLAQVLRSLDQAVGEAQEVPDLLLDRYRRVCSTLDQDVRVETSDGVLAGVAEGIDDDGALLLRTGERSVRVHAGDVTHVRAVG